MVVNFHQPACTSRHARLAGRHIVVTRPQAQAGVLAQAIAAEGGQPVLFPVLAISDLEDTAPLLALAERLERYDFAVFVSANAIEKAMALILAHRPWPASLKVAVASALAATLPRSLAAAASTPDFSAPRDLHPLIRDLEQPMFDLPGQIKTPVKIESVEMLKNGSNFFVRTRSTDGAVGITGTKQVEDFIPLFQHLVAPHFIGKDARDIESLVDLAYRENYKLASIPLWCCIAYVEQSLLDMLGKISGKSVGTLLGGVIRTEIPIYLSGSARVLSGGIEEPHPPLFRQSGEVAAIVSQVSRSEFCGPAAGRRRQGPQ